MSVIVKGIIGIILVPVYNWAKATLGLTGKTAAWGLAALSLLIAFPLAVMNGVGSFGRYLLNVLETWLVIFGASQLYYGLTKELK